MDLNPKSNSNIPDSFEEHRIELSCGWTPGLDGLNDSLQYNSFHNTYEQNHGHLNLAGDAQYYSSRIDEAQDFLQHNDIISEENSSSVSHACIIMILNKTIHLV